MVLATTWLVVSSLRGAPRIPNDDSEVLERLPQRHRSVRAKTASASPTSQDLNAACEEARRWMAAYRMESDPRCLGRAQAVLKPWWTLSTPPLEVRRIRASIRQSLHDFDGALEDLDFCIQQDPTDAQTWLTKSMVHLVRGDYASARRAALALTPLTDRLISATAAAAIASVNGQASQAYTLASEALAKSSRAPVEWRLWTCTLLGEIAMRQGQWEKAEAHFKAGLQCGVRDVYLLGAYADLLLERDRPKEVLTLLANEAGIDALLLRLALAQSRLDPASSDTVKWVDQLRERFQAVRARGEAIHRREEARFELQLLHHPSTALLLAQENWKVQREPADLKILLEAALAAGDTRTVDQLKQWAAQNEYEDVSLSRWLRPEQARP